MQRLEGLRDPGGWEKPLSGQHCKAVWCMRVCKAEAELDCTEPGFHASGLYPECLEGLKSGKLTTRLF